MKETYTFAAVILVSITALGFVAVAPQLQAGGASGSSFSLQFVRTGGFAGVNDTFVVGSTGEATYSSRFGSSFTSALSSYELSHLKQELSGLLDGIQPRVLQPKSGAADFFGYGLSVKIGDRTTELSWVDEWASSEPFPADLRLLQQTLQETIQLLSARATFANMNTAHADLACKGDQGGICGALTLTVFTDKSSYVNGDQVRILVAFSNTGSQSVNYTSPTPCDPDFRITVAGGNRTQDVSYSDVPVEACIQVLQLRSVGSNETILQSATWNLSFGSEEPLVRAQPGSYTVTVRFPLASFETSLLEVALTITVEM